MLDVTGIGASVLGLTAMSAVSLEPVLLVECIAQPRKQNQQILTSSHCFRARRPADLAASHKSIGKHCLQEMQEIGGWQTQAWTAYTIFQVNTPSLPRSTAKAVFAKDCLRAATSAAQRGWSVDSQAKCQFQSWRSWTVSTNWRRLKPTCIKSQQCDAMGFERRSELLSSIRFSSITQRAKDHGYLFAARNALRHMQWYDTCAAAMTDD